MNIASFDDLLRAARAQPEPQRLLFVFADAELPDDSTPEQRARFEAGRGWRAGAADVRGQGPRRTRHASPRWWKSRASSRRDWAIVFVAGLAGRDGRAPTSEKPTGRCSA